MEKIENLVTNNPEEFWDALNRLGPRIKSRLRCEALDMNGNITRDELEVENHWFQSYRTHCGAAPKGDFDQNFLENCCSELSMMRAKDKNVGMEDLNSYIKREEVYKMVMRGKNNKACGADELPYECLKSENCILILQRLFNKCLDLGILPSVWDKSIILPIPKGNKSISTEPLSF